MVQQHLVMVMTHNSITPESHPSFVTRAADAAAAGPLIRPLVYTRVRNTTKTLFKKTKQAVIESNLATFLRYSCLAEPKKNLH